MISKLRFHIDSMLSLYTSDEYREEVLNAKKQYLELTGDILQEHSLEFEYKMYAFNHWYLFSYLPTNARTIFALEYAKSHNIDSDIITALKNTIFSIFEVKSFSSRYTKVKDLIHDIDIVFENNVNGIGCVEGDIFSARIINYLGNYYMFEGMCLIPTETKKEIKQHLDILKKEKDPNKEIAFIFKVESLISKWHRFGRPDINKIFNLN